MKTIRIERLNPAFCALLLSPLVAAADDPPVLAAPSDVRDLLRDAQEARLPAPNASTQDLGSVSVAPADAASAAWFSAVGDGEAFAFEDPATSDTVLTNPASGGASRLAAEPDYDPNGLFLDAGYDPEENADLLPFYDPSLVTVRLWMSSEPSSDDGEGSPESAGDDNDGAGSGEGASGDEDDSAGSDQAGPVRGGPDRSGSPYPGYAPGLLASYYEFPAALSAVPDFTDLVPDFEQVEDTLDHPDAASWPGIAMSGRHRFAARYVFDLFAPATADYELRVQSDDGSLVSLDGAPLIDNDGVHGRQARAATVRLTHGFHRVEVGYFDEGWRCGLQFFWDGPDFALQTVPTNNVWHLVGDPDADDDGAPDWWESLYGFDPEDPSDAALDPDSDNLTNLAEFLAGTNPLLADSDGDGMPDGWELANGLDAALSERVAPTNRAARTVSFRYDPSGRLVSRTVSSGETARLFWLDYVVVLEEAVADGSTNRTVNLWGVDASETLGGAAGVGGLLSVSNGSGTFYPTFDGSGNVSEYLDRSGDVAAHSEYSPFGETLVREGDRADEFAHRFSTKAVVPGTPLYYYGSRFYSPVIGRWLNRDPIRENGGLNLYAFIQNTPANAVDLFGYEIIYIGGAAEEIVGTIDSVKSQDFFDFVSTWDNPPRVIGERKCRTRDGWGTKKIHAKDGEITEHIKQFVQSNPCKPVVLVGHSYGGDTAFDIAAELNGTPCLCLYIITLDAVSRFDSDVWYGGNPKDGTSVIEWINVYQEKGWEDDLNATPVLGHVTGALWAFAGLVITPVAPDTGSDLIASGGGQWNENSGADINLSFKDSEISHRDLFGMLELTIPEKGKSVRRYAEELNRRSCCESGGSGNE